MTSTTFIIIKCIAVGIFALITFGFFRYVNKALNDLKPKQEEPFSSFGWVFFKYRSTTYYAYNVVEAKLQLVQLTDNFPTYRKLVEGENVHLNLDLQKYLFDKAKGVEFSYKTITREQFMTAYNTL